MTAWWQRMGRYALSHAGGLALTTALTLAAFGMDLLGPWPMKLIVDHVLKGEPLPAAVVWLDDLPGATEPQVLLGWLVATTVLLFVAHHGMQMLHGCARARVANRMAYGLGAALFAHLQRLSISFHGRRASGDLARRVVRDTGCIRDLILQGFVPLVTSAITLGVMFVIMWQLDPLLCLIALVVALPLGGLMKRLDRPMSQRSYAEMEVQGELATMIERTVSALPIIQAYGQEAHEEARFRALCQKAIRAHMAMLDMQLWYNVGTNVTTALGTAAIMIIGGLHVLDGSLTVGSLLVFLAYLGSLYAPLEALAYASWGFASARAGAKRVLEVLDADEQVRDQPGAQPLPGGRARGHVRLEGVCFGYEPNRPVLHDITLEARPGELVALVGPTGAGKSTLISLVPRLFEPWAGRVTLDGHDLRALTVASVRAQVALVLQEPYLLPLSVAENIAYGRPQATRAQIEAAAQAACADEFIRRLPAGYDTVLGERGASLSGGEKQRLAIARALLMDAPILVLDEPTAALDQATEAELWLALSRLMAGRTTFVIAHRLRTVERADRIAVLWDGRLVEQGRHEELLAARGFYYRLHGKLQDARSSGSNTCR